MEKGIYTALSGAIYKDTQMEVIAQNLANVNTVGYKRDTVAFKDYLIPKDTVNSKPDEMVMTYISDLKTDFSSGNIIKTGNPLDVAIDGDGFIALEGKRYTRRGDFKKDSEGYLTSSDGTKVIGNRGPIYLPDGVVQINEKSDIYVNDLRIDSIKIIDFENKEGLKKVGNSSFFADNDGTKSKALLKQGYIETSNVDVVKEMVRMIVALREFEAHQKAIQTFEAAVSKVNNEIGRL